MSTGADAYAGGSTEPAIRRALVTGTLVLSSMIYSIDWTDRRGRRAARFPRADSSARGRSGAS